MKVVLQRVKAADVYHEKKSIATIKNGYVLLVGIGKNDTQITIEKMVTKILKYKLFENWKKNIVDKNFEILVLSQFTLFAKFNGNKPDFHDARSHEEAKEHFLQAIETFKSLYDEDKIKNGIFGVHLEIELVNDGPVTIIKEF
ncbi:D-tyrosyl-tRNA(Tyr) deacylase [Edhazardia aedis USNM 41457]|uniref:D-aminoacyl-tRNA deacylase n=1 Tax=Edhazardia aedis (strain USNM 41457) TaxID=1003232 RepID=J9DB33_EDHAE|nr:D-tyrosyl-tRNA(Tyr) deacylase [Edhazardia aedis USNM 41457]|eukprot:EJW04704.1 D-tyrosyl-tRNA(Tyr) deacylase [Edhazardia aedis USNM 41457]